MSICRSGCATGQVVATCGIPAEVEHPPDAARHERAGIDQPQVHVRVGERGEGESDHHAPISLRTA